MVATVAKPTRPRTTIPECRAIPRIRAVLAGDNGPVPTDDAPTHILVPHEQIAVETLDRLLAEVALRDDTDYGDAPLSLELRITRAREALCRGELVIVFDLESETVSLVPPSAYPSLREQ